MRQYVSALRTVVLVLVLGAGCCLVVCGSGLVVATGTNYGHEQHRTFVPSSCAMPSARAVLPVPGAPVSSSARPAIFCNAGTQNASPMCTCSDFMGVKWPAGPRRLAGQMPHACPVDLHGCMHGRGLTNTTRTFCRIMSTTTPHASRACSCPTKPAAIGMAEPSSFKPSPLMCVCVATRWALVVDATSSIRMAEQVDHPAAPE